MESYINSKPSVKPFPFSIADLSMYGHQQSGHRRPTGGGGSGRGGGLRLPQALPTAPNCFIPNVNPYFQNPTFQPNLCLPYLQNPNFPLQNPNFAIRNTALSGFRPEPPRRSKQDLDRVDSAVVKARRDFVAAGESVSAWKVSQSALLALQVDSWESLGFPMQEVPSLQSLIVTEGKVYMLKSLNFGSVGKVTN